MFDAAMRDHTLKVTLRDPPYSFTLHSRMDYIHEPKAAFVQCA